MTRSLFTIFFIVSLISVGCSEDPMSLNSLPVGTIQGAVFLAGPDTAYAERSSVRVQLVGTNFSTTTDALGRWSIDNVPTRTYDIKFSREGFEELTLIGQMFVGGGVVSVKSVYLYKVPTCPMILDEVRQEGEYLRAYAHASCKANLRRDNAVFFVSNSPEVSSTNYSYAVYNASQSVGGVIVGFMPLESIRLDPYSQLRLEDSIYVVAYNSGGGYTVDDQGRYTYTSLHPEPSRRLAVLIRE
jgi:hypothetical protein